MNQWLKSTTSLVPFNVGQQNCLRFQHGLVLGLWSKNCPYIKPNSWYSSTLGSCLIRCKELAFEAKILESYAILLSHIGRKASLFAPYKAWTNGWRVPLVWLMPYKVERGRLSFQCGTTKLPKVSTWSSPWPLKQKWSLH